MLSVQYGTSNTDAASYMAEHNPLRYRSYYRDDEGFLTYYLQSRYYENQFNRFLNADIPDIAQQSKDESNGLNLFAYCNNDPVNHVDPTGYKSNYHKGYKSPLKATKNFAKRFYKKSILYGKEICALIYVYVEKGKTYYGYTDYGVGNRDSCQPLRICERRSIPRGGLIVATIHTHLKSSIINDKDAQYAKVNRKDSYIIMPNRKICFFYWYQVGITNNNSKKINTYYIKGEYIHKAIYL